MVDQKITENIRHRHCSGYIQSIKKEKKRKNQQRETNIMKKRSERRKHCALPMQSGSVLHLCTKFEADCSIRSKIIKGVPKVGN